MLDTLTKSFFPYLIKYCHKNHNNMAHIMYYYWNKNLLRANIFTKRSVWTHRVVRVFRPRLFNRVSISPIDMISIINISSQAQVLDNSPTSGYKICDRRSRSTRYTCTVYVLSWSRDTFQGPMKSAVIAHRQQVIHMKGTRSVQFVLASA